MYRSLKWKNSEEPICLCTENMCVNFNRLLSCDDMLSLNWLEKNNSFDHRKLTMLVEKADNKEAHQNSTT